MQRRCLLSMNFEAVAPYLRPFYPQGCSHASLDLPGNLLTSEAWITRQAWRSTSGAVEKEICTAPSQYSSIVSYLVLPLLPFFFFKKELHYSKCVCLAVFLQIGKPNSLFHRLGGTADSYCSWRVFFWRLSVEQDSRCLLCPQGGWSDH